MEKKLCTDNDNCTTCAEPCTIPKLFDSCNYSESFAKTIAPKLKAIMKKLPYSLQIGLAKLTSVLPVGECIE